MSEATASTSSEPGPAEAVPAEAPVAKFKKKKKRGATRNTKALVDAGSDSLALADDDDDVSAILAATKEEQHFRQRSSGISAVTLATGEKVSKEQEVELAAAGASWTVEKGGVMPKGASAKDRDRDREGEEESVVKGLSNAFTTTQDVDFQDAEMKRFVDEQMMLRSGQPEEEVDTRTDYEKRRQQLFEVPEEYRAMQSKGQLKDAQSRGLLSNSLLSGIPEVDLGVENKFKNVQRVEEARLLREMGQAPKSVRGQKEPEVQSDTFLNYGRARFLTSSVQDKRAMGSSKGVVDVPGQDLADHTAAFEAAKKKAFDRGEVDSATYTAHPENVVERGRTRPVDGASDDHAVNTFRKKSRRY
eukprot:m.457169 g.457169  ORF g.457169 m.457169 type:complete len:359 (-) comp21210_c0_seq1:3726-4802(-)